MCGVFAACERRRAWALALPITGTAASGSCPLFPLMAKPPGGRAHLRHARHSNMCGVFAACEQAARVDALPHHWD